MSDDEPMTVTQQLFEAEYDDQLEQIREEIDDGRQFQHLEIKPPQWNECTSKHLDHDRFTVEVHARSESELADGIMVAQITFGMTVAMAVNTKSSSEAKWEFNEDGQWKLHGIIHDVEFRRDAPGVSDVSRNHGTDESSPIAGD